MRTGQHHHANSSFQNHVTRDATMTDQQVIMALLMDIREELRGLNDTLDCRNFRDIPVQLRGLRRDLRAARAK